MVTYCCKKCLCFLLVPFALPFNGRQWEKSFGGLVGMLRHFRMACLKVLFWNLILFLRSSFLRTPDLLVVVGGRSLKENKESQWNLVLTDLTEEIWLKPQEKREFSWYIFDEDDDDNSRLACGITSLQEHVWVYVFLHASVVTLWILTCITCTTKAQKN